jgi:hypothetical protein
VVSISTFKPGDVCAISKRPIRLIYSLTVGSLQRKFENGRTEKIHYRKVETKIMDQEKLYELKHVTQSNVRLVVAKNM